MSTNIYISILYTQTKHFKRKIQVKSVLFESVYSALQTKSWLLEAKQDLFNPNKNLQYSVKLWKMLKFMRFFMEILFKFRLKITILNLLRNLLNFILNFNKKLIKYFPTNLQQI